MNAKIPSKLVELARKEVGTEEVNGTNCGPRVDQYKAATNLPPHESWPWCSAFICWLFREALKATGVQETATFKRPTTAGAYDFANWSLAQDDSTQTKKAPGRDIQAGDIIIFTFSHIGLAIGPPDENGNVPTIEGNTDGQGSREGGAVLKKTRHIGKIRTRIRITV
jgi:hypothetical protein